MKPDFISGENAAGEAVVPLRRIIVRSLFDPVSGTRPGRWLALDEDGSVLLKNTASPLLSGARVLLKQGVPPETFVTMRHEGSETDAFRPVPLRQATALGISERDHRSVRFDAWKPFTQESHRLDTRTAALKIPYLGQATRMTTR